MRISDWSSDVCSSDLQPQPEQMAPPFRFRPVVVALAAVQGDVIVRDLDVARIELEFQAEFRIDADFLEQVERLLLRRRQGRHLREALRGMAVAALVDGGEVPLMPGIARRDQIGRASVWESVWQYG